MNSFWDLVNRERALGLWLMWGTATTLWLHIWTCAYFGPGCG